MPRRQGAGGAPRRLPGARAPGLRILTHNVRGLLKRDGAKVVQFVRQWACERNAHVVCIQETRVGEAQQALAETLLHLATAYYNKPSYTAFWGLRPADGTNTAAGVAILVRTDLIASGELVLGEGDAPRVLAGADGRTLQLQLLWRGHKLNLVNTYLPAGNSKLQRGYITTTLGPIISDTPVRSLPIVCGDFNFTERPQLDRLPQRSSHETRERKVTQTWQEAAATRHLVDPFRAHHPQRAEFSFFQSGGPARSRIDRFYVGERLLGYVEQCCPTGHAAPSDHRPVLLHLRPAAPSTTGKGLRKLRLTALDNGEGRAALSKAVSDLVEAQGLLSMGHEQLVQHWPTFKAALATTVRALAKEHALRRDAPAAARTAAAAERDAAEAQLRQTPPGHPGAPAALQRAVEADRVFARALSDEARPAHQQGRWQWLRDGEHPSPLMSKLMSPPAKSGQIPCLRDERGGGLITSGPQLAEHAVNYYADVSAKKQTDPAAQARVLDALTTFGGRIQPGEADQAGSQTVTEEEVLQAMKGTKASTSPGPDGIPAALWRWCKDPLAKVLARLYTAVGHTGTAPPGFLAGAVVALYKGKGDAAVLVNYRPITLLNTDYRLLAKVLATRWGPVLGRVVGREQTAFLPGRLIGENILFLQLLPAALRAQASALLQTEHGAAVFLDFMKAYDTVDRAFLLAVMQQVGAGNIGAAGPHQSTGMVRWAQILLSDTQAVAVINGHVSAARTWAAGVRQGCPLAPAMYLFVAWALSSWLQAQSNPPPQRGPSLGIRLGGVRVTCPQYADDSLPLLRRCNAEHVKALDDSMEVFGKAFCQWLNLPKCHILVFGWPAGQPMPEAIAGYRVVDSAKTLGIVFTDDRRVRIVETWAQWEELLKAVKGSYDKLARLPLSMFGRASAAAGYGVSKILYHAEVSEVPALIQDQLRAMTTKLVDKGLAPSASHLRPGFRLPGIRSDMLPGHPSQGGVGVLPWTEHVTARHAMWGKRLLEQLALVPLAGNMQHGTPPWVLAAAVILRSMAPNCHPAFTFLAACTTTRAPSLPAPALRRLAAGLAALGPPSLQGITTLPQGPWVAGMPLWQNPMLRFELPLAQRPSDYKEAAARGQWGMAEFAQLPEHRMLDLVTNVNDRHDYGFWPLQSEPRAATVQQLVVFADEITAGRVDRREVTPEVRAYVPALVAVLPTSWVAAARQGNALTQKELTVLSGQAVTYVLRSIGWPASTIAALPKALTTEEGRQLVTAAGMGDATQWVPTLYQHSPYVQLFNEPLPLTVRMGTRLQQNTWRTSVASMHKQCITAALQLGGEAPTGEQVAAELQNVKTRQKSAWHLKWDNHYKEAWWRLLLDGIPGAGGHGIALNKPCPCGWSAPEGLSKPQKAAAQKAHVFWGCTPAVAIRAVLQLNLPPGTQLLPKHMWLLQPPCAQVKAEVWEVVGMSALTALMGARKCMWALHLEQQRGVVRPRAGRARAQPAPEALGASSDEATDDDVEAGRRQHRAGREQAPAGHRQRRQRRRDAAPATTPHQYAARRAAAKFAAGVRKFVDVGLFPGRWVGKVAEDHCFIGVRTRAINPDENTVVQELVYNMRLPEEDLV
jgi:exonuclease III